MVRGEDRHHGLDLLAQGTVHAFGVDVTGQRRVDGADEAFADAVGQRVGVADPVGVHHHDEVHPGDRAGGFGDGLEDLGGVGGAQRLLQPGGVRDGLGDRDGAVAGLTVDVVARLEHQRQDRTGREQHHDRHLEDEYLAGDASRAISAQ